MRENDYVEGLEHFLVLSGEDTFDIDSILKQLPTYAGSTLSDLQSKGSGRVLDIGSGNGVKQFISLVDYKILIFVLLLTPWNRKQSNEHALPRTIKVKPNTFLELFLEKL